MIDLEETFEKFEDEFLKDENIKNIYSRPDMCAFMLLDRLLGAKNRDMVSAASHDQIWLDVDCDKLAELATEEDILTLVRCGVMYEEDSLTMYV